MLFRCVEEEQEQEAEEQEQEQVEEEEQEEEARQHMTNKRGGHSYHQMPSHMVR